MSKDIYVKSCCNCENGIFPIPNVCLKCNCNTETPSNWVLKYEEDNFSLIKTIFKFAFLVGVLALDIALMMILIRVLTEVFCR